MAKSVKRAAIWLVFIVILSLTSTANAFVWTEWPHGDAGSLLDTAQMVYGNDPLTEIQGRFGGVGVDMYGIYLEGNKTFSATTIGGADFDTQLFLFDADGYGIYGNDNFGGTLQSKLPANRPRTPTETGIYYLAISRFDRNPRNPNGRIFPNATADGAMVGPNGPGGDSPITGWSWQHYDDKTQYKIFLTGTYGVVPEPTSLSLLGLGLLGMIGFRKRNKKR